MGRPRVDEIRDVKIVKAFLSFEDDDRKPSVSFDVAVTSLQTLEVLKQDGAAQVQEALQPSLRTDLIRLSKVLTTQTGDEDAPQLVPSRWKLTHLG